MAERTWTCQHRSAGVKCAAINPKRKQLCAVCGHRRPATKRPAHKAIMDVPYPLWVEVFGERCGICGRAPAEGKVLRRDHVHSGPHAGEARGLACVRCNRSLPYWATVVWIRDALKYLLRAEACGADCTARLWELHEEAERRTDD